MKYKNIVILHGVSGLARESYFEHLAQHCRKLGLNVIMLDLGGYRNDITYHVWKTRADKEILPYLGKDTIVMAQSMGTNFAVKYIAERSQIIGLYISVAASCRFPESKVNHPCIDKIVSIFKMFNPSQADYNYFKNLPCPKFSFYSDNDPFTEQKVLQEYSSKIGSEPKLISGAGHFDINTVGDKFTQLEELISQLVKA